MADKPSLLVNFRGLKYWLLSGTLEEEGALAPLSHCDENGDILPRFVFEDSFAHYFPEAGILRYGHAIGSRADLIPVPKDGADRSQDESPEVKK